MWRGLAVPHSSNYDEVEQATTTVVAMLNKNQLNDVLERALATYLQTITGLLTAAQFGVSGIEDLSTLKTCAVSALPAVLSAVKSVLAVRLPYGDDSASVLRVGYEKPVEVVRVVEVPTKKATAKKTAEKKPAVKKPAVKKTVR